MVLERCEGDTKVVLVSIGGFYSGVVFSSSGGVDFQKVKRSLFFFLLSRSFFVLFWFQNVAGLKRKKETPCFSLFEKGFLELVGGFDSNRLVYKCFRDFFF